MTRQRRWSEADLNQIAEARAEGMQWTDIAEMFGVSYSSLRTAWRYWRCPESTQDRKRRTERNEESKDHAGNHRQQWCHEDDQWLLETLELPVPEVAELLGRSMAAIISRRNRIRPRPSTSADVA